MLHFYSAGFGAFLLLLFSQCNPSKKSSADNVNPANYHFKCSFTKDNLLTNECLPDYTCTFDFYTNSKLKITEHNGYLNRPEIVSGKKTVFHLESKYNDNPGIADDEFREVLKFEVALNGNYFHYAGTACSKLNAIYSFENFSRDRGHFKIRDGCFEGIQLNENDWQILLNFQVKLRSGRTVQKVISAKISKVTT